MRLLEDEYARNALRKRMRDVWLSLGRDCGAITYVPESATMHPHLSVDNFAFTEKDGKFSVSERVGGEHVEHGSDDFASAENLLYLRLAARLIKGALRMHGRDFV